MESFISKFSQILQELHYMSAKDVADLKRNFKGRSKEALIDFILFEGMLDKGQLLKALSLYYNIPSFDVSGYLFDHELVSAFPSEFLRSNAIIPLADEDDIITIIAADPESAGLATRIEKYTDSVVQYNVGLKQDIWDAIQEFSQLAVTEESFEGLDQEFEDRLEDEPSDDSLIDADDYY